MKKGFTLIELLVVLAIIGILATGATAVYNRSINKSRVAVATGDIKEIFDAILLARETAKKVTKVITGKQCSECVCRGEADLSALDDSSNCVQNWYNAKDAITSAAEMVLVPKRRDPWGSPYLLDENELENGNCNKDMLRSAGRDKTYGTSDDIVRYIPFYSPECM